MPKAKKNEDASEASFLEGVSMGGLGGVRGACGGFKENESLAPLYYPDTLVNPDTLWNN